MKQRTFLLFALFILSACKSGTEPTPEIQQWVIHLEQVAPFCSGQRHPALFPLGWCIAGLLPSPLVEESL